MKCWKCGQEGSGVCIFCGRAVCKKHAKRNPNILGLYDEAGDVPKAIVVENALWCGHCKPISKPVELPEIE